MTATPLRLAGLVGDGASVAAVPAEVAPGTAYVAGTDVLRLPDGSLRYLPEGAEEPVTVPAGDVGAATAAGRTREWLAGGEVPGRTTAEVDTAARALLDLRLLTRPNGAVAAAWHGIWQYSWPRDSSWVAAALAWTGHLAEARSILGFAARTQRDDGSWHARVLLDGSGPPDDRPWQRDACGWLPWAVWSYARAGGEVEPAAYRMVLHACDHIAACLDERGLPPATPDYWETRVDETTLGLAAPLLAGLRAGVEIAAAAGRRSHVARWRDAADRLAAGIDKAFGGTGYQRTPDAGSGADAAVTFLAPPFAPERPEVTAAVLDSQRRLTRPNGGVVPGEAWRGEDSWTPETAFFALAAAASGRHDDAARVLGWLAEHRTALGALPEKVTPDGAPAAVAPLAWTAAAVLLTLVAQDPGLPVPVG